MAVLPGLRQVDAPGPAPVRAVVVRFMVRFMVRRLPLGVVAVVEIVTIWVRRDDRSLSSALSRTVPRTDDDINRPNGVIHHNDVTWPHAPRSVEPMNRPDLHDALRDRDTVLRAFVAPDGSLKSIPTKIRKRLVVLDLLCQEFEPGERYAETEVNNRLRAFHPDVAALRRYLVEESFLDRAEGRYWRAGGSVGADGADGTSD